MSYDIFIESSVYNFGSRHREIIKEELNKVENPQWKTTDALNIEITEDFDMRHCEALLKARDRAWKESQKKEKKTEYECGHDGGLIVMDCNDRDMSMCYNCWCDSQGNADTEAQEAEEHGD